MSDDTEQRIGMSFSAQRVVQFTEPGMVVIVPDMDAVDLTALVKRDLNLKRINPGFEEWNYHIDCNGKLIPGRGLKFESRNWKYVLRQGDWFTAEQIRSYAREEGFFGHTAAFMEWSRTCGLQDGIHATMLDEVACWRDKRETDECPYIPYVSFGDSCEIFETPVRKHFQDYWSFVGFRLAQG